MDYRHNLRVAPSGLALPNRGGLILPRPRRRILDRFRALMAVYLDGGSILLDGGSVAMHEDCCCSSFCCDNLTPSTATISASGCCAGAAGTYSLANSGVFNPCRWEHVKLFAQPGSPCDGSACEIVTVGSNTYHYHIESLAIYVTLDNTGSGTEITGTVLVGFAEYVEPGCTTGTGAFGTSGWERATCNTGALTYDSVVSSNWRNKTPCYASAFSIA